MTDGRIGLKIKQIVKETPNASLSEIRSALGSSITPGNPCPSKSTIHQFLGQKDYNEIKILKKPLISSKA